MMVIESEMRRREPSLVLLLGVLLLQIKIPLLLFRSLCSHSGVTNSTLIQCIISAPERHPMLRTSTNTNIYLSRVLLALGCVAHYFLCRYIRCIKEQLRNTHFLFLPFLESTPHPWSIISWREPAFPTNSNRLHEVVCYSRFLNRTNGINWMINTIKWRNDL